jgi:DNA-directed RNA polymerase subunit D
VKIEKRKKEVFWMFDIKKIYEEGNLSKYLVKDTNAVFMNTLRRTIMTETPCLAIDKVTIYDNDSVVFDEMLANRLGLVPIKTDKAYKKGDSVKLVLEAVGPYVVTGKDIKSTDPAVEVADPKILISKLGKDQKMKIELLAVMKCGSDHARFQPAIVSYNQIIEIDNSKKIDVKAVMAESSKLFEEKAGKLFFADPYNIKTQNPPLDILDKFGVGYDFSETDYVLTIETIGQLTAIEVVDSALKVMAEKIDALAEGVKKL